MDFWTQIIVSSNDGTATARSAEVDPPGLGSKCGKWVERFSDFGKYKGYIRLEITQPLYLLTTL